MEPETSPSSDEIARFHKVHDYIRGYDDTGDSTR